MNIVQWESYVIGRYSVVGIICDCCYCVVVFSLGRQAKWFNSNSLLCRHFKQKKSIKRIQINNRKFWYDVLRKIYTNETFEYLNSAALFPLLPHSTFTIWYYHLLLLKTADMLYIRSSINLCIIWLHLSTNAVLRPLTFSAAGFHSLIRLLCLCQTCSLGFKSGERASHSKTFPRPADSPKLSLQYVVEHCSAINENHGRRTVQRASQSVLKCLLHTVPQWSSSFPWCVASYVPLCWYRPILLLILHHMALFPKMLHPSCNV